MHVARDDSQVHALRAHLHREALGNSPGFEQRGYCFTIMHAPDHCEKSNLRTGHAMTFKMQS